MFHDEFAPIKMLKHPFGLVGGISVRYIDPLTAALIAGGVGLTAGSMFGGAKESKVKIPAQVLQAMEALRDIGYEAKGVPSTSPYFQPRGIAGKSILEQITGEKATGFVTSPMAEELGIASEQARKFATTPPDVTQLPEYKGILADVTQQAERMANRIAQGLQIKGAATTASGRDVLGRHVTTTSQQLLAALAPFAEAERGRQFAAIPLLGQIAGQKERSDVTKIGVGADVGSLDRMIQQAINDAIFEGIAKEYEHKYKVTPGIMSAVIAGGPPATVTGGGPSALTQAAPLIGQILPAILAGQKPPTASPEFRNIAQGSQAWLQGY